ncbi:MAG: site-specific DNA-methyltransferase [Thiopseudomonas sp.]|nr:site-specific DNA-methyltransferase [Thiopseudomonas sp.]MCK9464894.1 site-specific DNA-methyltransferase [Thiopseudomonas sp.]
MEKLKMHSKDLSQDNLAKIQAAFPNCVTERKNAQGQIELAIDFDLLRQELSANIVEGPQERYRLDWPGKREAMLTANAPIAKTLRPAREESVNFDDTENLFIEGDNLDALKLLQETYLGKVKMIYIDPPYNTGNDFVYEDDFAETTEEFLQRSNQKDEQGNRLVSNPESNGRFHSDWLSMMLPRLRLARNLLTEDGVVFISIDDGEYATLKSLCDETFGSENHLASFVWRTDGNFDNQAKVKNCHEYIVAFCKNISLFPAPPVIDPSVSKDSKLFKDEIRNTIVKNGPANPISEILLPAGFPVDFESGVLEERDNSWPHYLTDAVVENGVLQNDTKIKSGWSSKDLVVKFISNNCQPILDGRGQETRFLISKTGALEVVKKRSESQSHVISVLTNIGSTQSAGAILRNDEIYFAYPKPVQLTKYLLSMNEGKDFIALDFFAGSSTTAHAAMQLNAEDGGNRKFIMVQLPEEIEEKHAAYKAGYKTIAEISKERIRRAGAQILEGECHEDWNKDIGFRVLKVDTSNMQDVYYQPQQLKQNDLFASVDNIKPDRSSEDLLFQVLLDWGVDLTLPIRRESIQGKEVFIVDDNALIACFEQGISEALIHELAELKPLRAVFRDNGFASDAVKVNVTQIFKQRSPITEVKAI